MKGLRKIMAIDKKCRDSFQRSGMTQLLGFYWLPYFKVLNLYHTYTQ